MSKALLGGPHLFRGPLPFLGGPRLACQGADLASIARWLLHDATGLLIGRPMYQLPCIVLFFRQRAMLYWLCMLAFQRGVASRGFVLPCWRSLALVTRAMPCWLLVALYLTLGKWAATRILICLALVVFPCSFRREDKCVLDLCRFFLPVSSHFSLTPELIFRHWCYICSV